MRLSYYAKPIEKINKYKEKKQIVDIDTKTYWTHSN